MIEVADPGENEGRRAARAEAEAFARMQIGTAKRKIRLRPEKAAAMKPSSATAEVK